jgi:hypothetical protein
MRRRELLQSQRADPELFEKLRCCLLHQGAQRLLMSLDLFGEMDDPPSHRSHHRPGVFLIDGSFVGVAESGASSWQCVSVNRALP